MGADAGCGKIVVCNRLRSIQVVDSPKLALEQARPNRVNGFLIIR